MKKVPPIQKNSAPKKGIRNATRSFQLPEQFLAQLNEFSAGGFLLITGAVNGEPQVYMKADGSLAAISILNFARDYAGAACKQISDNIRQSV